MSGKTKKVKTTIELIDIDSVEGAHYNPRDTVQERLDHLRASIKHLGFLMPLYINQHGKLLSGHQRTKAAKVDGYTKLPVVRVEVGAEFEKGINIAFNRVTNDMAGSITGSQAFAEFQAKLEAMEVGEMAVLPPDSFTCMTKKSVLVEEYLDPSYVVDDSVVHSNSLLARKGVFIPIIVSGGKVVNGKSRLASLWDLGYTHCEVIEVPPEVAPYADLTLNLLSMDFNFQEFLADELRFNAYRRGKVDNAMLGLSRGWSYPVFKRTLRTNTGDAMTNEEVHPDLMLLPHLNEEVAKQFKTTYGDNVVEWGAGTLRDNGLVTKGGLNVLSFEPYHLRREYAEDGREIVTDTVDPNQSRQHCAGWLDGFEAMIKSGKRVSSVVSSYMLNSVPHHKDRMACLAIMGALCGVRGIAYVATQHISTKARGGSNANGLNPNMEPNMVLGTSLNAFKVQKYFYPDELEKMFRVFFNEVEVEVDQGTVYVKATRAKRPNPTILKEALELEFDLPYADGSRMGLVDRAKELFSLYTRENLT